jgi:hypothetical protein
MTNHVPDPHSLARTSPLVEPIWERQPFESAVEFERFQAYMTLGAGRTYKAAAKVLGLADSTLAVLGGTCRWVQRAEAHDVEMERIAQKLLDYGRVAMLVRQAQGGMALQEVGLAAVTDPLKALALDAKDGARVFADGVKIEREARGIAEKHELEVTMRDATTMTEAERRAEYAELRARLDAKIAELGGNQDETEDVQSP